MPIAGQLVYFCPCPGRVHLCENCYRTRDPEDDMEHGECQIDAEICYSPPQLSFWMAASNPVVAAQSIPNLLACKLLRLVLSPVAPDADKVVVGHAFLVETRVYTALHTIQPLTAMIDMTAFDVLGKNESDLSKWMCRPLEQLVVDLNPHYSIQEDWIYWNVISDVEHHDSGQWIQCPFDALPCPGDVVYVRTAETIMVCLLLPAEDSFLVMISEIRPLALISGSPVLNSLGRPFGLVTTASIIKGHSSMFLGGCFLPQCQTN